MPARCMAKDDVSKKSSCIGEGMDCDHERFGNSLTVPYPIQNLCVRTVKRISLYLTLFVWETGTKAKSHNGPCTYLFYR